jgi:hypothetical protein
MFLGANGVREPMLGGGEHRWSSLITMANLEVKEMEEGG